MKRKVYMLTGAALLTTGVALANPMGLDDAENQVPRSAHTGADALKWAAWTVDHLKAGNAVNQARQGNLDIKALRDALNLAEKDVESASALAAYGVQMAQDYWNQPSSFSLESLPGFNVAQGFANSALAVEATNAFLKDSADSLGNFMHNLTMHASQRLGHDAGRFLFSAQLGLDYIMSKVIAEQGVNKGIGCLHTYVTKVLPTLLAGPALGSAASSVISGYDQGVEATRALPFSATIGMKDGNIEHVSLKSKPVSLTTREMMQQSSLAGDIKKSLADWARPAVGAGSRLVAAGIGKTVAGWQAEEIANQYFGEGFKNSLLGLQREIDYGTLNTDKFTTSLQGIYADWRQDLAAPAPTSTDQSWWSWGTGLASRAVSAVASTGRATVSVGRAVAELVYDNKSWFANVASHVLGSDQAEAVGRKAASELTRALNRVGDELGYKNSRIRVSWNGLSREPLPITGEKFQTYGKAFHTNAKPLAAVVGSAAATGAAATGVVSFLTSKVVNTLTQNVVVEDID